MKIAIYGYGNLGRGVEAAMKYHTDCELCAVFTRRDPASVTTAGAPVYSADDILSFKDKIDVLILCGGSATDLPKMTHTLAEHFNVVDSYDTHATIPEHFERVNAAAEKSGHIAMISGGWDPGLFSIARLYASSVLPEGKDYTFWGRGVSQGHSDAIRRIEGVLDARQYTVPVEAALEQVRAGENPQLTTRQKHTRQCYVVAAEGADLDRIRKDIVTMPNYFADYDTTVYFITQEELDRDHKGLPHGGTVFRTGVTGDGTRQRIEYTLELGSNPEFTASVLIACARAAYKMAKAGQSGAKTIFDIPPVMYSSKPAEELRKTLL